MMLEASRFPDLSHQPHLVFHGNLRPPGLGPVPGAPGGLCGAEFAVGFAGREGLGGNRFWEALSLLSPAPLILGCVWRDSWAILAAGLAWPAAHTPPQDAPSSLLVPLSPLTLPSPAPSFHQPLWPPLSSPGALCPLPSPRSCHWGQSNFIKLDVVKHDNFAKIIFCLRVNLPRSLVFCFGTWQDRLQCLETSLLLSKYS